MTRPKPFTKAEQKVLLLDACTQICDLHDIEFFLKEHKGFFHEDGTFEEHHDYVMYHNLTETKICPVYGKEVIRLFPLVWKDKEGWPQIKEDMNGEYYNGNPEEFNQKHLFGLPKAVVPFTV